MIAPEQKPHPSTPAPARWKEAGSGAVEGGGRSKQRPYMFNVRRGAACCARLGWGPCSDRCWLPQAGQPLDVIYQPLERVKSDQVRRIGHEVGQRVDVVQVDVAVALALQILNPANIDVRRAEDRE